MGMQLVQQVLDTLKTAGFSVRRAYPGTVMAKPTGLEVAVQLQQLNQAEKTATVCVTALVPVSMGAAVCEDGALRICRLLESIGGVCRQERTDYRMDSLLFSTEIFASFSGTETESGWVETPEPEPPVLPPSPPTFSVKIGQQVLEHAVSFRACRAVQEEIPTLTDASWEFTLEEVIPLDVTEQDFALDMLEITVSRIGRTEIYSQCVVTEQIRQTEMDGQHQIYKGTAAVRTVS